MPYTCIKKGESLGSFFLRIPKKTNATGCWIAYSVSSEGYGRVSIRGKSILLHRLAAHLYLGLELADWSLNANHRCPEKRCFNPEHIYVGTAKDNAKDSINSGTFYQSSKTHCPRCGGPYRRTISGRNTNGRYCRKCRNDQQNERYHKGG